MSSRPPAISERPPCPPGASTVMRLRRSCPAASCASAASSAALFRFMARGLQPKPRQQSAVARHVGVAGGQELLAVEDGVGAGEEAQRLQLIAHRLAAGRQAYLR